MKITAIMCGRPGQIGEKITRIALKAAKDEGAQVEMINLMKLDIKACVNCGSCVRKMRDPDFKGHCPLENDDMAWLDEKMLESDAILFVAPMYEAQAAGSYRIMCDRIGPSHDVTFLKQVYNERLVKGIDPEIDERWFKERPAALIAHGGSEWSYLGFPSTGSPAVSMGMPIVDFLQLEWNQGIAADEERLERVALLGKNLVLEAKKPEGHKTYHGKEGACPVCHCGVVRIEDNGKGACALCGAVGRLELSKDGRYILLMSEEEKKVSHMLESGRAQHMEDLKNNAKVRAGLDREAIAKRFDPLNKEIPVSVPEKQAAV